MSPGEPLPDWIPNHLPDRVREQIFELTKPVEVESVGIECSEHLIRHWCEAVEDGNPLYLDPEYARSRGFRDVVAPPGMAVGTLSTPYRWPWPPRHYVPSGNIHYRMKKLMNLPVGVVVDNEVEYLGYLELGDTLSRATRLTSISGPKKTRLGEGYFWVIETTSSTQRGDVVSKMRMTMFAYNPTGSAAEDDDEPADGRSQATEDCLDTDRCSHPDELRTVHWDDVSEGDDLPTLVMPITVTRCVYLASATRDFSPHHHNRDYARNEVQARDMFLNTPFNFGILSRFLTDWAGPAGMVRRLKLSMRNNICAGDDMLIDGKVVRKYVDNGDHCVDVDIQVSTQDGPAYEASSTVVLPVAAA